MKVEPGKWYRITVDGYDGRHYVAAGRVRGYVTVKGVRKIWAEAVGFDLLFDKEQIVRMELLPTLYGSTV